MASGAAKFKCTSPLSILEVSAACSQELLQYSTSALARFPVIFHAPKFAGFSHLDLDLVQFDPLNFAELDGHFGGKITKVNDAHWDSVGTSIVSS